MSKKYEETAIQIIDLIGGKSNITASWHCVTRLRFNVVDSNKVKIDDIKKMNGIMGAQFSGSQFQVIIGNDVPKVFAEVETQIGVLDEINENKINKKNIVNSLMDTISGVFTPVMPALIGGGLLKGFLALMTAFNWISTDGSTYALLNIIGDSAFYFMPFIISVSSARRFKTNEYLALVVAGSLLYPTIVNGFNAQMTGVTVQALDLFGIIPIPFLNYSASAIPIILSIYLLKYVYNFIKNHLYSSISTIFAPMLSLLIVIPITLTVLGPIGTYVGVFLGMGISWLFSHSGLIAGGIVGATYTLLVMTGMHWALMPIMLTSFAQLGFDNTLMPGMLAATFALAGATFAVFFKTKNSEMKQISLSAGISAIIGLTEPALYGVALKLKKPLYASMIAGGVVGSVFNLFDVKAFGMPIPSIIGLTTGYVDPENSLNIIVAVVGTLVAFLGSFALVYIIGFKDEIEENLPTQSIEMGKQFKLVSPVEGKIIPTEIVSDNIFAKQIMGYTIAIQPKSNHITSPLDGEVIVIAETSHAIGLRSNDGVEVLLHLGIDTVELNGENFELNVKVGDSVKIGDSLVRMDVQSIENAGYDSVVLMIVTNTNDYLKVLPTYASEEITPNKDIAVVIS